MVDKNRKYENSKQRIRIVIVRKERRKVLKRVSVVGKILDA